MAKSSYWGTLGFHRYLQGIWHGTPSLLATLNPLLVLKHVYPLNKNIGPNDTIKWLPWDLVSLFTCFLIPTCIVHVTFDTHQRSTATHWHCWSEPMAGKRWTYNRAFTLPKRLYHPRVRNSPCRGPVLSLLHLSNSVVDSAQEWWRVDKSDLKIAKSCTSRLRDVKSSQE